MTEARAEGGRRASGQVTDEPEVYNYEQAHPGRRPGRSTHSVDDRERRIAIQVRAHLDRRHSTLKRN